MAIDSAKERERLAEVCRLLAEHAPPRAIRLLGSLISIRGTLLEVSNVIKTQAWENERLREALKYYQQRGTVECRECQGQGTKEGTKCPECKGSGRLP